MVSVIARLLVAIIQNEGHAGPDAMITSYCNPKDGEEHPRCAPSSDVVAGAGQLYHMDIDMH